MAKPKEIVKPKRTRWEIEVTEGDIERAKKNDSYNCVVAQAVARSIPDATRIDVDSQCIRFSREGVRLTYLTPYTVVGYVVAFDAGDPIEPFKFRLDRPQVARRVQYTQVGLAAKREAQRTRRAKGKQGTADEPLIKTLERVQTTVGVPPAKQAKVATEPKTTEPKTTVVPGRQAPPRVFRTKQRSYGHRLLRLNQDQD